MTRMLRAVLVALLCLLVVPLAASAHEKRDVGNGYTMVVGFLNEPPVVDQLNGLDLTVTQGGNAAPVEGLADTLKAEVKAKGQTMPLTIEADENVPGHYEAAFLPTEPGTYQFHIYGTINGQNVDQAFTSGPNTFDDVNTTGNLSFPTKVDSAATLAQHDQTTRLLAYAGLAVGVLGLIAGVLGLAAARQANRQRVPAGTAGQDASVRS